MINGVHRAQARQYVDSVMMSRKSMMNIMNVINDKWGPPGPGKAVSELCRDHSGELHMANCLHGADLPLKRCPLGSGGVAWEQCWDDTKCNDKCNEYDKYDKL